MTDLGLLFSVFVNQDQRRIQIETAVDAEPWRVRGVERATLDIANDLTLSPRARSLTMPSSTGAQAATIVDGRTALEVEANSEIGGKRSAIRHMLIAELAAGASFAAAFKAELCKGEGQDS